jgi:hypothetical protein
LPVTNELNVTVERCSGAACVNFTQIQSLPAGSTSYQDSGLPTNVVWRYQVRAINNVGPSAYSNVDQANTIVPTQVTGLTTTIINGQRIDLSWADVAFEQQYVVERCLGNGCGSFTEIATLPQGSTTYADNDGVAFNTSYTYRVTGVNVAGRGTSSDLVVGTTSLNAPSVIQAKVLNRNQVRVNWTYGANMQQYVYQVLRCVGEGCDATAGTVIEPSLSSATLEYVDNVPQGIVVSYAVRAATLGGTSSALQAAPARTPTNMASAVAIPGVFDVAGGERNWVINVPADALALRVRLDSPSGDADMYVKFGVAPTTGVTLNDAQNCVPYTGATPEICTFNAPAAGDWYAMLQGFSAYSNATLKASLAERFGWTGTGGPQASNTQNFIVAQMVTLTEPVSVTHLGARLTSSGGNIRFAVYSNRVTLGVNEPNAVMLQAETSYPVPGIAEAAVAETILPAGLYWIAVNTSASGMYESPGGSIPVRYYARDYALGWEAVWPAAGTFLTNYQPFNFWIRGFR